MHKLFRIFHFGDFLLSWLFLILRKRRFPPTLQFSSDHYCHLLYFDPRGLIQGMHNTQTFPGLVFPIPPFWRIFGTPMSRKDCCIVRWSFCPSFWIVNFSPSYIVFVLPPFWRMLLGELFTKIKGILSFDSREHFALLIAFSTSALCAELKVAVFFQTWIIKVCTPHFGQSSETVPFCPSLSRQYRLQFK